jgi:hypothetical protein
MAPCRAPEAERFFSAEVPASEMPLLQSRVKSGRELQTVRQMVGGENNEWGATRIWHGRTPQHSLLATA